MRRPYQHVLIHLFLEELERRRLNWRAVEKRNTMLEKWEYFYDGVQSQAESLALYALPDFEEYQAFFRALVQANHIRPRPDQPPTQAVLDIRRDEQLRTRLEVLTLLGYTPAEISRKLLDAGASPLKMSAVLVQEYVHWFFDWQNLSAPEQNAWMISATKRHEFRFHLAAWSGTNPPAALLALIGLKEPGVKVKDRVLSMMENIAIQAENALLEGNMAKIEALAKNLKNLAQTFKTLGGEDTEPTKFLGDLIRSVPFPTEMIGIHRPVMIGGEIEFNNNLVTAAAEAGLTLQEYVETLDNFTQSRLRALKAISKARALDMDVCQWNEMVKEEWEKAGRPDNYYAWGQSLEDLDTTPTNGEVLKPDAYEKRAGLERKFGPSR